MAVVMAGRTGGVTVAVALTAQPDLFHRVHGALALAVAATAVVVLFGLALGWVMDSAMPSAPRPVMDGQFGARGAADYAQTGGGRVAPVGGVARR